MSIMTEYSKFGIQIEQRYKIVSNNVTLFENGGSYNSCSWSFSESIDIYVF